MDTEVFGDTATIHAMYALGTQRRSVLHSMVKKDGVWRIDQEEQLSPKIRDGTIAVDVQLDECAFVFDSNAITTGDVAFRVENAGAEPLRLVLNKLPEEIDLMPGDEGEGPLPEGLEVVAFVDNLEPGEQINFAFTEPMDPGRYALLCSLSDLSDPEGLSDIAVEFTVP